MGSKFNNVSQLDERWVAARRGERYGRRPPNGRLRRSADACSALIEKVVRIVRAKAGKKDGRGARVVAHLRGRGDIAMSTDAIMALTRDD
jgi:hypothetical protein